MVKQETMLEFYFAVLKKMMTMMMVGRTALAFLCAAFLIIPTIDALSVPARITMSSSARTASISSTTELVRATKKALSASVLALSLLAGNAGMVVADDVISSSSSSSSSTSSITSSSSSGVTKVPLFTRKGSDLVPYTNVERGFRLLRPFGYNEFEGGGGGYAVKFASLISSDENVVVGSAPASAGKTTILDYGTLDALGEKLAAKRGGVVKAAEARETDGVVFYSFLFESPLDDSLPRTGRPKPTKSEELYELCVAKGRLWSVQATSNDRDFPAHADTFKNSLLSFSPRM